MLETFALTFFRNALAINLLVRVFLGENEGLAYLEGTAQRIVPHDDVRGRFDTDSMGP